MLKRVKAFLKNIPNEYAIHESDCTLAEKILKLEERIEKLEDENISLTNELYRLENSLDARVDILAPHTLNLKDFTLGDA